jgi:hypothetical protein
MAVTRNTQHVSTQYATRNTPHVVAEIGVISAVRPPETAAET